MVVGLGLGKGMESRLSTAWKMRETATSGTSEVEREETLERNPSILSWQRTPETLRARGQSSHHLHPTSIINLLRGVLVARGGDSPSDIVSSNRAHRTYFQAWAGRGLDRKGNRLFRDPIQDLNILNARQVPANLFAMNSPRKVIQHPLH